MAEDHGKQTQRNGSARGKISLALKAIAYGIKHKNDLRMRKAIEEARPALVLANMELGKLNYHEPDYARRVAEFDEIMIELTRAKWYTTRAMASGSRGDWNVAFASVARVSDLGGQLRDAIRAGNDRPVIAERTELVSHGTEIAWAGDVPLVPEICPIVILQGSDFEMGYQYAQQLVQIFGPWVLQRKAGQRFTPEEVREMRLWEQQIARYAPEILEMCRGWVAGATAAGVPMSYDDVLDLWTGHKPPASNYFGLGQGLPDIAPPLCSGTAAWGRATRDGRLVTGSTGDHDCMHMATIVAFPESGNSFIYTPFGVTGDVGKIGSVHMYGHPGMNSKGLAFVEHGGGPKAVEPREAWGYGIRMATAVFHILRFANSAAEAREMELSYPVGDVGSVIMSTPGAFWADSTYGYVIDSRKDPVIVREAGTMGETDFLYACNSALHPDVGQAPWMQKNRANWTWDPHGGWYPAKGAGMVKTGDLEVILDSVFGLTYYNSCQRSQYAFKMLNRAVGQIDLEYIKMMYRQGGTIPSGSWQKISAEFKHSGRWGDVVSLAHASNALVTLMQPDNGAEGIYAMCVGPAGRGLAPMTATGCCPIYAETNAFWEIKLAGSPAALTSDACERAQKHLAASRAALSQLSTADPGHTPLSRFQSQAEQELKTGLEQLTCAARSPRDEALAYLAKATRAFTRAQVRALQVYQALVPQPAGPKDCAA